MHSAKGFLSALFAAALLLAGGGLRAAPGEAPRPRLAVSVFTLGPTGGELKTGPMVDALNEGGWCDAVAAPAEKWNQRPDAAGDRPWLSVVLTGFGESAQAFAFLFEKAGAPPRLAARVPYRISWAYRSKVWVVPAGRIAGAVRESFRTPAAPATRPPVTLVLQEKTEEPAGGGAMRMEDMTPVRQAATLTKRDAFPPLEAMLAGAMLENGLAPAWTSSDRTLQAELTLGFQAFSLRLTAKEAGSATKLTEDGIPEEDGYGYLTRLLFRLSGQKDARIADDARLDRHGPAHLLLAASNRLCLSTARGLFGFNPKTGQQLYPSPDESLDKREAQQYAVRPGPGGTPRLFRHSRGLAEVNPLSGSETVFAPESPYAPWGFEVADDLAVVAKGADWAAYRRNVPAWRMAEKGTITAGPCLLDGRLYAGTEEGALVCRAMKDGAEVWRTAPEGAAWSGPMTALEGLLLAFDRNTDTLQAFHPADGKPLWKQALGDVPLKAPFPAGDRLAVAAKNNRLLLLDPKSGAVTAETRWPAWLVDVTPVTRSRALLACSDIAGRLTFLDGALKPVAEVRLKARPSGPLLHAPAFPLSWAVESAEAEEAGFQLAADLKPVVVAGDTEGFCAIVPTPP